MIEAKDIKQQARGYWGAIATALAPQLKVAHEKLGRHVPCPIHGGTDGFRLFKDFNETGGGICNTCGEFSDGYALLQWLHGWNFPHTLKAVGEYLNIQPIKPTNRKGNVTPKPKYTINLNYQHKITNTLNQCQRMNWPLAKYLKNRGLGNLQGRVPRDILAINSLPYWEDINGTFMNLGDYPAMIGVIRNLNGEVVSLHRTYLSEVGKKAPVSNSKKIMPPAVKGANSGSAIQLFEPTEDLAITEGIETALAVHLSTGIPVWAAISSTMLEQVQIPETVKNVYIMADKDLSGTGLKAAVALAKRVGLKHTTKIVVPDGTIPEDAKSLDWLDVYINNLPENTKPKEASPSGGCYD
tara:strand:+ start:28035 stop:29096 length:1062 start_codon:yes stop_codon:yes gene_type:complete